jgi:hypothetical protein
MRAVVVARMRWERQRREGGGVGAMHGSGVVGGLCACGPVVVVVVEIGEGRRTWRLRVVS